MKNEYRIMPVLVAVMTSFNFQNKIKTVVEFFFFLREFQPMISTPNDSFSVI